MGLFCLLTGERNKENLFDNIRGNFRIMKAHKNYNLCGFLQYDLKDLEKFINNKNKKYHIIPIDKKESSQEILFENIQEYINMLEKTENVYIFKHLDYNIKKLDKILNKARKEEIRLHNKDKKKKLKELTERMEQLDIQGGTHYIFQENTRPFYHIVHHSDYERKKELGWKIIGEYPRRSLALDAWHELNGNDYWKPKDKTK